MVLRNKKSTPSGIRKHFLRFFETTDPPKVILLRYTIILLLVVTGLFHLRSAFIAQLSQNQGSHLTDFSPSLTNPDTLANMAREEHLSNANLQTAQLLYNKALENFVLHLPSWFGIAEVLNDQGKVNEAVNVLQFIHNRFDNNKDTAWSKALLASTLDNEQILTENLVWLAKNYPAKKKAVFALATLSWERPDILMSKFGRDFYVDILQEYIKLDELAKTMAVWDQITSSGSIQQDAALQYVDYLIGQNVILLADKVWSDTFGPDEPLLHNGDFEKPILGSGFGWRISRAKGMSWKPGNYGSGLEITFDGSENVVFSLSQTLPLNPGKYIFNGTLETDDLTTDQLPFWKIQGFKCTGLSEHGQMALPNQHATEFVLPFVVPENCELIRIALVREQSYHFDNKIEGKVTVNNLNIQRADPLSSVPGKTSINIPGKKNGLQKTLNKTGTNISIDMLFVEP